MRPRLVDISDLEGHGCNHSPSQKLQKLLPHQFPSTVGTMGPLILDLLNPIVSSNALCPGASIVVS